MRACCWAIAEFHFNWIGQEGENSVLWKSCQKLLLFVTHELIKVRRCFICQKNSRGVWITWLKGYFIVTTYEDARAWQSWGRNLRTPCMWRAMKVEHETQTAPERAKPLCFLAFPFSLCSSLSESPRNYQFIIRVAAEREKGKRCCVQDVHIVIWRSYK